MNEKVVVLAMLLVNGIGLWLVERFLPHSKTAPADRIRHLLPNLALASLLIAVNLGLDRAVVVAGVRPSKGGFGLLGSMGLPGWAKALAVVVVLDGLAYLAHVLMHRLPFVWRVHRVHHSDAHVDVTTAFRQHPLETFWRYSFQFLGASMLGASSRSVAVYLALSTLNAQFEHAYIALPARVERYWRLLFTTPAMHRVHHSRRQIETDTNYSNIFSLWDRLFGTYRAPRPGEEIGCGLDECDAPERQRTAGLLALPFEA